MAKARGHIDPVNNIYIEDEDSNTVNVVRVELVHVDAQIPSQTNVKYHIIGGTLPSATFTAPEKTETRNNIPEGNTIFVFDQGDVPVNNIIYPDNSGSTDTPSKIKLEFGVNEKIEFNASRTEHRLPLAQEMADGYVNIYDTNFNVPVVHKLFERWHSVTYGASLLPGSKVSWVGNSQVNISTASNNETPTDITTNWTERHFYNINGLQEWLSQTMTLETGTTIPAQGPHFRTSDSSNNQFFFADSSTQLTGFGQIGILYIGDGTVSGIYSTMWGVPINPTVDKIILQ
ncbi:MAG: hypothetical protein WC074_05050 [bacterium]